MIESSRMTQLSLTMVLFPRIDLEPTKTLEPMEMEEMMQSSLMKMKFPSLIDKNATPFGNDTNVG